MKALSLTKRELVLMYILLCLLLVLGGWFFVFQPSMKTNSDLQAKYNNLELEYQQEKSMLEVYEGVDASIVAATQEYENYKNGFLQLMNTEAIDKYFTGTIQKYGLVPVSLTLEEAKQETISAFNTGATSETDVVANAENTETVENVGSTTSSPVYVMNVKQVVTTVKLGNNTLDYIEFIKNTPGIQITDFSYSTTLETTSVSLSYKLYMIEK